MVPLSNAWKSGAASWTTQRRQDFANDLSRPQLWTVTDNVNESKGDQGPEVSSSIGMHMLMAMLIIKDLEATTAIILLYLCEFVD